MGNSRGTRDEERGEQGEIGVEVVRLQLSIMELTLDCLAQGCCFRLFRLGSSSWFRLAEFAVRAAWDVKGFPKLL